MFLLTAAGFLLPGLAAGWMLARGSLFFSGNFERCGLFALSALCGALLERGFRNPAAAGAGILCFLFPVPPCVQFCMAAAAWGILSAHALPTFRRRMFLCGIFLAVTTGFFAGGQILLADFFLRIAQCILIPPAVLLTGSAVSGRHRFPVMLCTLAAAGVLAVPLWKTPGRMDFFVRHSGNMAQGGLYKNASGNGTFLRTFNRLYLLPHDLTRRQPDILPASLQPEAERIRVLVVPEAPSTAAKCFAALGWVAHTDTLFLSPLPADPTPESQKFTSATQLQKYLAENPDARYDLVFMTEIPGAPPEAQKNFIRFAAENWLAPHGVLAFPRLPELPIPPGFRSGTLPGSEKSPVQLLAKSDTPLADTYELLEQRLQIREKIHGDLIPEGMMKELLSLRPEERNTRLDGNKMTGMLRRIRPEEPVSAGLAVLTGILFSAAFFWFGRYPEKGEQWELFARGTALIFGTAFLAGGMEKFTLLCDFPLAALFGWIALAFPHRTRHARRHKFFALLAAGAAFAFSGQFCGILSLFLWVPALLWGSGCGRKHAPVLYFAGMTAGICLVPLLQPAGTAALAMLLVLI